MNFLFTYRAYFMLFLAYIILLVLSYENRGFQSDDALIYQRYTQNFLAGNGLVYNPGELFNGLTSPLFSYLMLLVSLLIGDAQIAAILLSTLFMLGAVTLFALLFAKYEKLEWVSLGAVFTACFSFFYYVYGLETPLFMLLIGWCIYLFEKEDIFWLGVACALLLLTRSEGIFLILALAIEHFRQRRSFPAFKYFILPFAILAAVYVFNYLYYGHFLPDTGMAKIYQGQSGWWGGFLQLSPPFFATYHLGWFFSGNLSLFYLLFGCALAGVIALGFTSLNIILVSFIVFYSAFYVGLHLPGYHWYYGVYYILLLFYAAFGLIWITRNLLKTEDIKFKLLSILSLILVLYILTYQSLWQTVHHVNFAKGIEHYTKIGYWLKEHTPKESKIALVEIGHVGYYSDRYIIDILGLVSPLNAKFVGQRNLNEWLKHYKPDYMLTHTPPWDKEQSAKVLALVGDISTVDDFNVNNFQLLKVNQLHNEFLPDELHSDAGEAGLALLAEDKKYMTMTHAPGYVRFALEAGRYAVSGEFGMFRNAYISKDKATDGVNFKIRLVSADEKSQVLFERFLNPAQQIQDQGLQTFNLMMVDVATPTQLYFETEIGQQSFYDLSFWRNLQIKQLQ